MTTLEQAAREALEALDSALTDRLNDHETYGVAVKRADALRAALAAGQAQPVAWVRAIDEAMVTHHIGTADPSDDYETARHKLNTLFCHAQSIGEYFAKQDAAPPAQPLTDHQIRGLLRESADFPALREHWPALKAFARAIEHAHGIGANA